MATQDNEPRTDSTTLSSNRPSVPLDHPIESPGDDRLGRAERARTFARNILALDASRGVTTAVVGPGRSGKTSFINLMRSEFDNQHVIVLDFTPLMSNDSDDLIFRLPGELSANPNITSDAVARNALRAHSTMLLEHISTAASQSSSGTITDRRKTVEELLRKRQHPIVVLVDDVDKLSAEEIRAVFTCMQFAGALPNIIYVVAFDRDRTAHALADDMNLDDDQWGYDYLDRIFQEQLPMPPMPTDNIGLQLHIALAEATDYLNRPYRFEDLVTPVVTEIVRPLLSSMRDIQQYVIAVSTTGRNLGDSIPCHYLLALEAVRLFLPDTFNTLYKTVGGLTTRGTSDASTKRELTREVRQVLNSADGYRHVVERVVERLFFRGYMRVARTSMRDSLQAAIRDFEAGLSEEDHGQILEDYLNWWSRNTDAT